VPLCHACFASWQFACFQPPKWYFALTFTLEWYRGMERELGLENY
jgi:hypothetical protein